MLCNDRYKRSLFFSVILFAFFFLLGLYLPIRNDDLVFQEGIQKYGSFLNWCKWFSSNWGGRVVPQGILVLLLQLPDFVFSFINAVMWVSLLAFSCLIFDIYDSLGFINTSIVMLIAFFSFIPMSILIDAVFWKCALVLYLWGSSALLMAIYPFVLEVRGINIDVKWYGVAVVGAIYASSFEQIAVIMCWLEISIFVFSFIYNRRVNKGNIVLLFFSLLSSILFLSATGNKIRYQAAVLSWYSKWDMYSLTEKLMLGINYAIGGIEKNIPLLLVLLAGMVCYISIKNNDRKLIRFINNSVLCFFALNMIHRIGSDISSKYVLGRLFELYSVETSSFDITIADILKESLNVQMFVMLGCGLSTNMKKKLDLFILVVYIGGFGTALMMGFSPTIHISGVRPLLICCLCLLFCTVSTISKIAYMRSVQDN